MMNVVMEFISLLKQIFLIHVFTLVLRNRENINVKPLNLIALAY